MTKAQLEQELISKAKRIDLLEAQNAVHRELHDRHEEQLTRQSEGDFEYFNKHNDFKLCQELMNKNHELSNKIEDYENRLERPNKANDEIQLLKNHIVRLSMGLK